MPTPVPVDRARLTPTIVHIGPGVFHRAHQAVYADDLLRLGVTDAAIRGLSLRSAAVCDSLRPSGFRYRVVSVDGVGATTERTIDALVDVTVARHDPLAAVELLADPTVRLVTVTVTERGYCAVEPGGPLDTTRPDVTHDLANPHAPRSLPGVLVAALARRRERGVEPFVVASCDNLPSNGVATARVVTAFADLHRPDLADWIEREVRFPCSMVDRMVPSIDTAVVAGSDDGAPPIVTEPFRQWVLEDVPGVSPRWGDVGVELVDDVGRHERAKLRILNAAHSALAYWGLLAGYEQVWQAATDPVLVGAAERLLVREAIPALDTPPGWDLHEYAVASLARFANRSLPYATAKVGGDGSQKLPVRLLPSIRAAIAAGRPTGDGAAVLAAWTAVVAGPRAAELGVVDPGLDESPAARTIARARAGLASPRDVVRALLALPGFVDPDDPRHAGLVDAVTTTATRLWSTRDPDPVHRVLLEGSPR